MQRRSRSVRSVTFRLRALCLELCDPPFEPPRPRREPALMCRGRGLALRDRPFAEGKLGGLSVERGLPGRETPFAHVELVLARGEPDRLVLDRQLALAELSLALGDRRHARLQLGPEPRRLAALVPLARDLRGAALKGLAPSLELALLLPKRLPHALQPAAAGLQRLGLGREAVLPSLDVPIG